MESAPTPGAGAAAKVAGKIPKIVKATKATGKAGKAAGVAQAGGKVVERGGTVLQSGGHTLTNRTLKGLGLNQQQANKAMESMKKSIGFLVNFIVR